jgi:hypothetical protein
MEDIKLVKEITNWGLVGVRTNRRPKIEGEMKKNELKKRKLRNWSCILKERKASNDLVQKTEVVYVYGCSVRRRRKRSYPMT